MNFSKKLRKYFEVIRITNNELLASPGNIIGRIFVNILRILLFIVLYEYVYSTTNVAQLGSSDGVKLVNVIWGLAFVQLIVQSTKSTFLQIRDEIVTGQIALKLNKPYSFLIYYFVEALGQVPLKFLIFFSTSFVVLNITVGMADFNVLRIVSFIILYAFGVILGALIQILVGLAAFWIENPDPIMWILNKTSWIFNGTFVPLALLPVGLQQLALYVPLGVPYNIGRLFEINNVSDFLRMFAIQLAWIVFFAIAIRFVFKKGVKQVSINGG